MSLAASKQASCRPWETCIKFTTCLCGHALHPEEWNIKGLFQIKTDKGRRRRQTLCWRYYLCFPTVSQAASVLPWNLIHKTWGLRQLAQRGIWTTLDDHFTKFIIRYPVFHANPCLEQHPIHIDLSLVEWSHDNWLVDHVKGAGDELAFLRQGRSKGKQHHSQTCSHFKRSIQNFRGQKYMSAVDNKYWLIPTMCRFACASLSSIGFVKDVS